jgi:hypothetical protein
MEPQPNPASLRQILKVLVPLLALPVIIFWRPVFFYVMDDWTALIQMVEYPFGQYLISPDGEQWFPFFHLVFYGLVKIAGEHYSLLVLINCLGTGINALLLYCFFRRFWSSGLALILSLLYAGAAVHHAIAWNAFYLGYLLCLSFFLGALLLTDSYLSSPSAGKLGGIGLGALLSILSHNYTLVGLMAFPLYALLLGGREKRRRFWALTGVIGVVYLLFICGYLLFAGLPAAASHNQRIFAGLPGPAYLLHLVYGAFLAPFFYLFWGHFHFPIPAYIAGVALLALCLIVIRRWGEATERRLALWALATNALPFILVSLTRYQRSVNQAFVARYGIFTLIGALILVGTAWRLWEAKMPKKSLSYSLALGLLLIIVCGQAFSLPRWQEQYLQMSLAARHCYTALNNDSGASPVITREEYDKFCPTAHPSITPDQARAIRRFLQGRPAGD